MLDARQATATREDRRGQQSGQTLVEFTMVIPMVVVMLLVLIELALGLNASLAVSRASQHGAHVAASGGNLLGTDCRILEEIEQALGAPNDPSRISEVVIERTALVGNFSYAQQTWGRYGETDCLKSDGSTVKVPYTLAINGYPEAQRCTVLGGCPSLTPPRSSVDNIGVIVRYTHQWVTPLNGVLDLISPGGGSGGGGGSSGWSFEQRNIFRIEPTL